MHATGGVDLGLEFSRNVGELGTLEDIKVVVGGVAAGVALGADGGTWKNIRGGGERGRG